MDDPVEFGIWPPYEAFYIEAMLFSTTAAINAASQVRSALDEGSKHLPTSNEWQHYALAIVDGIQALATHSAALSRYLWPASKGELAAVRARKLRQSLGVREESCLRNRDLRNHLEHFDERLDQFCATLRAGEIVPSYVGPLPEKSEVPSFLFRGYYTDVAAFEVLGHRFEMAPILEEVQRLHDLLMDCANSGRRLPAVEV